MEYLNIDGEQTNLVTMLAYILDVDSIKINEGSRERFNFELLKEMEKIVPFKALRLGSRLRQKIIFHRYEIIQHVVNHGNEHLLTSDAVGFSTAEANLLPETDKRFREIFSIHESLNLDMIAALEQTYKYWPDNQEFRDKLKRLLIPGDSQMALAAKNKGLIVLSSNLPYGRAVFCSHTLVKELLNDDSRMMFILMGRSVRFIELPKQPLVELNQSTGMRKLEQIFEFANKERIGFVVDSDNQHRVRIVAVIKYLLEHKYPASKINLIICEDFDHVDSDAKSYNWSNFDFPGEMNVTVIPVKRILGEKSPADVVIAAKVAELLFRRNCKRVLVCSSDCDFSGLLQLNVSDRIGFILEPSQVTWSWLDVLREQHIFHVVFSDLPAEFVLEKVKNALKSNTFEITASASPMLTALCDELFRQYGICRSVITEAVPTLLSEMKSSISFDPKSSSFIIKLEAQQDGKEA